MQASEADHDRVTGASTVRILEAGRRFTPYEVAHPERTYEEHVVTLIEHRVVDRSYETNANEPEYGNTFEAMPARVALTPHRVTKRPRIEGTQVAIVAGPEGEATLRAGGFEQDFIGACPDCGSQLAFIEGCAKCHVCGYSECG